MSERVKTREEERGFSRSDIDRVVGEFYSRVRQDPILGPVFDSHVTDWSAHEEKISQFWANAILKERGYSGNPMRVHAEARGILVDHFELWLRLFDEVLHASLPGAMAEAWSQLAHRIGNGLQHGLKISASHERGDPPTF